MTTKKKSKNSKNRIKEKMAGNLNKYVNTARENMPQIREKIQTMGIEAGKKLQKGMKKQIPKLHTKAQEAADYIQNFVNEHMDEKDEKVDEKIADLKELIKKEPLKAVSASFLLGILIGRLIK